MDFFNDKYDTGVPLTQEQPVLPIPPGTVPAVIVTGSNGAFFGYVKLSDIGTSTLPVTRARHMLFWYLDKLKSTNSDKHKLFQTCDVGPDITKARVGARRDLVLRDVRLVLEIDHEPARQLWERAYWVTNK